MEKTSWIPLFPDQASSFAWQVDALYFYILAVCLFFGIGCAIAIFFFAVKYREKKRFEEGAPIHGSMILELTWTVIPFVIAMTIFVAGAYVFFNLYRAPADATEVYVVGKQWMWKFQHGTGQRQINELNVPVGKRIKLVMTTEDVIHDLYFPAFRTKADVVPGRYTTLWFEATKKGRYRMYCAEYCGLNHSGMIGWVNVMEQRDFDNWLAGQNSGSTPMRAGENRFNQSCASCHNAGALSSGPSLNGAFGNEVKLVGGQTLVRNEEYIRNSILNPAGQVVEGYNPVMPSFKGQLTEEQIIELIEYIKSLK